MKQQCCRCFLYCVLGVGITTFVAFALIQSLNFSTVELPWVKQAGTPLLAEQILGTRSGPFCGNKMWNLTRKNEELKEEVVRKELSVEYLKLRGVGLLHSLTDAALFEKAISVETSRLAESASLPRVPKIAFMFLTQRDLPFAPLWNRFFAGHEDLYNIYVHMWPLQLNAIQKDLGVFWGRVVPSAEAKRLTPGLIADARRLLANALLDDASNEWFAVVSESCIPIHGFPHIYSTLASTNKTFMEVNDKHWDMPNRYKARGDEAMKPEVAFWQFRVGSQFWIMRRRHAVMTVADTKYWKKFNLPCLPQYVNCFPEEHYFATLLNILEPFGTTHYTATFVDWSRMEPGGHPRRFWAQDINPEFIKGLQNGPFLFARKFDPGCLGPLLQHADAILSH